MAEEGVTLREIAEVIGAGLRLPVESITPGQAPGYYGSLAQLAALDLPASGAVTRRQLDRAPTGPGLLTDLRETDYDALLMLFNEICTKIYMEWLSITVKL